MTKRIGRYVLKLENRPVILGNAAVVGKTEGEGPLADEFDYCYPDDGIGKPTWEKAETELHKQAIMRAISKSGKTNDDIDIIYAGDLLDQCVASTFGIRELNIPFAGIFGACSTMAYSLCHASVSVNADIMRFAVASTSSHFCTAEKQFRFPLEYGGQRPPTAQRTVTGAGACVIGKGTGVGIEYAMFGRIHDLGITDANNMGAAMAPAAARTITDFLHDTDTQPADYDLILTGDLGKVGSDLLLELMCDRENIDISAVHNDCGLMIFDTDKQDVHSGGSGCGCSAAVVCSKIIRLLKEKQLNRVLFVGTGALMSPVTSLQGESIPSIAHAVLLTSQGGEAI